ncbi:MAG: diacylglycerol kinase [Patescibacteria group bacterium]|jgi:diacylglycerol kinase
MFKVGNFFKSFRYALHGLRYIWCNEQSFRVQVLIAWLVILAMIIFRVSIEQAVVLIMLIMFVLVLETANTIVERFVDILKPRLHSYVEIIKDMMAAAVLLAAIGSAIVALIIFVPYLVALFS